MEDKSAAILTLLVVLLLIYLSNSGKLAALKSLLSASAGAQAGAVQGNPAPPANAPGTGGISGPIGNHGHPIGLNEARTAIAEIEQAIREWQSA